MKIAYFGSGGFGIESLNALRDSDHSVRFIVTQPPRAAGRGRKTTPTAVALWAQQNCIPYVATDNAGDPAVIEQIRDADPDLILVIAFGQKICDELIALAPKGMINVHGSLLPKYRGAAPINWAIVSGETETGVSIATITPRWDAGAILAQAKTSIGPDETAEQLSERLAAMAAPLLVGTINKIAGGTAVYTLQDESQATRAPKLKKSDGCIDFDAPAETIRNRIRGFWPWPGASALYSSKTGSKTCRVTFTMAQLAEPSAESNLAPGTLDENLNVVCAEGALRITKIKPAGAQLMSFDDFVNGRHVAPLDRFTKIEQ